MAYYETYECKCQLQCMALLERTLNVCHCTKYTYCAISTCNVYDTTYNKAHTTTQHSTNVNSDRCSSSNGVPCKSVQTTNNKWHDAISPQYKGMEGCTDLLTEKGVNKSITWHWLPP